MMYCNLVVLSWTLSHPTQVFNPAKYLPARDLLAKEQQISPALRLRWPKWPHQFVKDTKLKAVVHAKCPSPPPLATFHTQPPAVHLSYPRASPRIFHRTHPTPCIYPARWPCFRRR
jgi:hypothetical protein